MENKITITILGILLVLLTTTSVSAEFWACFQHGEVISYCGGYKPDWTCPDNMGCENCMSVYNEAENCYIHGSWPKCNQLPKECSAFGNGSANLDITPPILTINSPKELGVYTSRSTLLNFNLNEEADVYYYDNINGRGRWTRVCSGCSPGNPSYSRQRSFKEGLNNLTFRAVDVVGNEVHQTMTFFIDSKKPKIKKTLPRKGFASGLFEVEFQEANPETLILKYGNLLTGYRETELNLNECRSIKGNSDKFYCDKDVPLEDYDSQDIEYWFKLTDIANSTDESKHIWLEVDTTAPVLNNPDSFWQQGEGKYNKYIYFELNITEKNFDEISYYDYSEGSRARWRKLCTRLKDGICKTKKSFRRGNHVLDIQITDEVGNAISTERVEFLVE